MKDNAIIALADSNYFEMLEELIDSINKHPESENVSICVLDAGLTVTQIKTIEKKSLQSQKSKLGYRSLKLQGYWKRMVEEPSFESFFTQLLSRI